MLPLIQLGVSGLEPIPADIVHPCEVVSIFIYLGGGESNKALHYIPFIEPYVNRFCAFDEK